MRFHLAPRPLLQLLTTILLSPQFASAIAVPAPEPTAGISINDLFARDCTPCGYWNQICCYPGTTCATNANDEAVCSPDSGAVTQAPGGADGYWQYYTTTYVETDYVTMTSVYSSYFAAATGASTLYCNTNVGESYCGNICCASNQYCFDGDQSQCAPAAGGVSSLYHSSGVTGVAGAPIRPTTSGNVVVTATVTPTQTVGFIAPVPTGANITVTEDQSSGGGGLSGGAIAGIVIGVLAGLLLLALIIFYCCIRGIWAACFGGKRKRRTEVEEYERHSHHHSGGGGGRGRTWYGAARPSGSRVEKKDSHKGRNLLGVGAGLAALWAILGLKRRHDSKHNEKYSEYSYSSDYYTSASSASSDDRRTRDTRRSMSRR